MNDLDMKLAEWRFPHAEISVLRGRIWIVDAEMPDGADFCLLFTESLDACFKWLVPQSPSYNPDIRLIQSIAFDYGTCRILDVLGDEYVGEEETPALSLCRAIEKLIEDKK